MRIRRLIESSLQNLSGGQSLCGKERANRVELWQCFEVVWSYRDRVVVMTPIKRMMEQWWRTYETGLVIYKPDDIRYLKARLESPILARGDSTEAY
jgi:hypothetical protein